MMMRVGKGDGEHLIDRRARVTSIRRRGMCLSPLLRFGADGRVRERPVLPAARERRGEYARLQCAAGSAEGPCGPRAEGQIRSRGEGGVHCVLTPEAPGTIGIRMRRK